MAANVSVGDARAKSKAAATEQGRSGDLYSCEIPILVNGVERGVMKLEYFVPEELTNNQVAQHLAAGLYVRWIAS
jgi:hypothetical protein